MFSEWRFTHITKFKWVTPHKLNCFRVSSLNAKLTGFWSGMNQFTELLSVHDLKILNRTNLL